MAVHKSSAECVREMDIKYPRVGARINHGAQKRAALAVAAETVLNCYGRADKGGLKNMMITVNILYMTFYIMF